MRVKVRETSKSSSGKMGVIKMDRKFVRKTSAALAAVTVFSVVSPGWSVTMAAESGAAETQEAKSFVPSILRKDVEVVSKIPRGGAYIPADTEVRVELVNELTSKKARTGDAITMRLLENIIINDVIVAPAGTPVKGVVEKATKAGGLGRAGKLIISLKSFRTINGVEVPLEYVGERRAGHDGGAVAVFAVVSLVGGLFMKGKNVTYPAGSVFEARVVADTDLRVKLDELASVMDMAKPHGVSISIK